VNGLIYHRLYLEYMTFHEISVIQSQEYQQ